MFEIETKELKISEELNGKIDIICRFACVKYEFIPGNIKSIKNTKIAYVKPYILKVKENDYIILEECDEAFINGYNEKIRLKDLENSFINISKKENYSQSKMNLIETIINSSGYNLRKSTFLSEEKFNLFFMDLQ